MSTSSTLGSIAALPPIEPKPRGKPQAAAPASPQSRDHDGHDLSGRPEEPLGGAPGALACLDVVRCSDRAARGSDEVHGRRVVPSFTRASRTGDVDGFLDHRHGYDEVVAGVGADRPV